MPGTAVVVAAGSLSCTHQGAATVSSVSTRLTVAGHGVLLSGEETALDFAGCTNQTPNGVAAPCVSDPAVSGIATRLTVGGTPVLLAGAGGLTHPKTPGATPGTWSVGSPGQTRLQAT